MRLLSICFVALALAGCAQTNISGMTVGFSGSVPRPKTILVSDFLFSTDVVALDRGFTARLSRKLGDIPPHERKQRTAERVNDEIVATIVATLREAGLEAQPGSEEGLSLADDAVVVTGRLRAIDEGNRTQRNVIGFGAGRSGVVADMALTHVSNGSKKQLISFTAEAQSRRRPGAIVTAPIGAATSAAISAASAAGGVVSEKLSADVQAQARSLGREAGERIVAYAKDKGWLGKPEGVAAASSEKAGM
jgi:Domain of unknown function (DUF4410)